MTMFFNQSGHIIQDWVYQFMLEVLNSENMATWKVIIWDIKGEGECVDDMEIIYIDYRHLDFVDTIVLFMHEVAHAKSRSKHHDDDWMREFERIVESYLPGVGAMADTYYSTEIKWRRQGCRT